SLKHLHVHRSTFDVAAANISCPKSLSSVSRGLRSQAASAMGEPPTHGLSAGSGGCPKIYPPFRTNPTFSMELVSLGSAPQTAMMSANLPASMDPISPDSPSNSAA